MKNDILIITFLNHMRSHLLALYFRRRSLSILLPILLSFPNKLNSNFSFRILRAIFLFEVKSLFSWQCTMIPLGTWCSCTQFMVLLMLWPPMKYWNNTINSISRRCITFSTSSHELFYKVLLINDDCRKPRASECKQSVTEHNIPSFHS